MSADISKEIETIKHAVYGEDIRTAIADAMQKISNGVGISDNVKTALLNIINHIAYEADLILLVWMIQRSN